MISLEEAAAWLEARTGRLGGEAVPIGAAAGRVLEGGLEAVAEVALSGIDGWAVVARETEGASDYAPLPVRAVDVVAGAAMPGGMDAVVAGHLVAGGCVVEAVAAGDGVAVGDGLRVAGGSLLRPGHVGVLARRGMAEVRVVRRPVVRVRVAGAKGGADAVGPMLGAAVKAVGGVVGDGADLVVMAGRSGAGADDNGVGAFSRLFAHGVRVRPGETVALGVIDGVPALLLPGDPVACLVAFWVLVGPVLRRMGGRAVVSGEAVLTRKIAAGLGEVLAVPVMVRAGRATPVAAVLSLVAGADGVVLVPEGSEGFGAGSVVTVWGVA